MFEAVIFDWDGTLADSREAILTSFHSALREILNIDVEDEFIERRIGVGASWTFREILQAKSILVSEEIIERLVAAKVRVAVGTSDKVKLFPGARELLDLLKGKIKMGLASMNNRSVINTLLGVLDVSQYFSVVVTVDEVSRSKPDPEIFLKTCQNLGALPHRCLVVEDSIFGVEAAKRANMGCIAVAQGAYSKEELAKASPGLIVDSIQERESILCYIMH
jgi:HAD superfamily hydrolase (TIGR01509 family)